VIDVLHSLAADDECSRVDTEEFGRRLIG
jgi:hypothetical protein